MHLQSKTIAWVAIVAFGLLSCPGMSTPANAIAVSTTTTIGPFDPTIDVGGAIDFTATLVGGVCVCGPLPLSGETIDFTNSTTSTFLGSGTTDLNGMVTLLVAFGVVGTFDIEASFAGAGGNLASSASTDVTVNPTPVPAALPLFATGLGGLGLLGWRRKRKAQAVA